MGIMRHRTVRLVTFMVAFGMLCAGTSRAQDDASVTKERARELLMASVEIEILDRALSLCQAIAPDYAAANEAIMDAYMARHSVDKVRPLGDQLISKVIAPDQQKGQKYNALVDQVWEKAQKEVTDDPDQCRDRFAEELEGANLRHIAAVVDHFELDMASGHASVSATDPALTSTATSQDPAVEAARQKQLRKAHVEIALIDGILAACEELAPNYATANQAIMASFAVRHSLDKVRPMTASILRDQPEVVAALDTQIQQIRNGMKAKPELCRESFESTLNQAELPNVAAVVQSAGINATGPEADVSSDSGGEGRTESGDELDDAMEELVTFMNTQTVLSLTPSPF